MMLWRKHIGDVITAHIVKSNYKNYNYLAKIEYNSGSLKYEYFYDQDNAIGWCYQESERLLKQALKDCINGMESL